MASGDNILAAYRMVDLASDAASHISIPNTADTTNPQASWDAWSFPQSTYTYTALEGFAAFGATTTGGVTLRGTVTFQTATSNDGILEAGFLRLATATDLTGQSTVTYKTVTITAISPVRTPIAFSLGFTQAEADSIVALDHFRIYFRRQTGGGDDALGPLEFNELISLTET